MEGKFLMKTLFESYGEISRVISAIDRKVLHRGVHSHSAVGYVETLDTMNDILKLIIRKRELAFIKNLMSQSLTEMPLELAKLLVLKYIEKQKDKTISEVCKIGTRTVHRRLNKALKESYMFFVKEGYGKKEFEKLFAKEKWLSGVYDNLRHKNKVKIETAKKLQKNNSNFAIYDHFSY